MESIVHGLVRAWQLLVTGDPEVMEITLLTLRVSSLATLVSVLIGVPLGLFLALRRFRGRQAAISLVNLGMGMPPVVVGLWISLLLWRSGPLGHLNLIYTPTAIWIAQSFIALPVVAGFTMAGIQQLDPRLGLQLLGLGASPFQLYLQMIREARFAILAAVIAGFGAVISEVGASMMVGGNIRRYTQVLTTAIAQADSMGDFELAIALSLILLLLAYLVTLGLTLFQQWRPRA